MRQNVTNNLKQSFLLYVKALLCISDKAGPSFMHIHLVFLPSILLSVFHLFTRVFTVDPILLPSFTFF